MTVKIIADTLSDITEDIAADYDLTIVPLYVRFGEEIYKDRVEITAEQFYERLVREKELPSTTQPTPNDFLSLYEELAKTTDEILVICLSSRLSGTVQSALQAREMMENKCRIEVVDSGYVALSVGLTVISVARKAMAGAGLDELAEYARKAYAERTHFLSYFDTLRYLAKGGRIGKAQGLLGSVLSVKPILTMREGEMAPLTRMRSKNAGLDYLINTAASYDNIEMIGVEHCNTPEDTDEIARRLEEKIPGVEILRSTISPVVGTYSGPGALSVSVLQKE